MNSIRIVFRRQTRDQYWYICNIYEKGYIRYVYSEIKKKESLFTYLP